MKKREELEKIIIKKAKSEDIGGIRIVWYETWLDTYPSKELGITREDIEERFSDYFTEESLERGGQDIRNIPENHIFLVAKIDEEVIGFCRIVSSDEENRLRALYVLPDMQKKGVGKKLWNEVLKTLDKTKPTYVNLADYNVGARIFYEKSGFKDTGKRTTNPKLRMKSGAIIPEMEMMLDLE